VSWEARSATDESLAVKHARQEKACFTANPSLTIDQLKSGDMIAAENPKDILTRPDTRNSLAGYHF